MAQLEVREGLEMCVIGAYESRNGLDEEEEEAVSFWKHEGWYGHDGYWRTRGGGERSSECGYYCQSSDSTCVLDSSSSRLEAVVATQGDVYPENARLEAFCTPNSRRLSHAGSILTRKLA